MHVAHPQPIVASNSVGVRLGSRTTPSGGASQGPDSAGEPTVAFDANSISAASLRSKF